MTNSIVIEPGLYRHYKGGQYQVIGLAKHSESEEDMVVYRALYGAFGLWVRPAAMFAEIVSLDDQEVPRFSRVTPQTGVLEVAVLTVKPGLQANFEAAFIEASKIIQRQAGFIDLELKSSIDSPNQYLLMVNWVSQAHHQDGFRQSADYRQWSALLHHFYHPFPQVEYYR